MAGVETIIVGGGIQAGSPFQLNFIPYITAVTPPQVQSSPIMRQVTGANQGIVIAPLGADPQPAAVEVLRIKGGMICEGPQADSVQIGRGAATTVNGSIAIGMTASAQGSSVVIGRGSTDAAAGNGGNVAIGPGITISGAPNAGQVAIGNGAQVANIIGGSVAIGLNARILGGVQPSIVIGGGYSLVSGSSQVIALLSQISPTARSACVLLNNGSDAVTGNNQLRIGSASAGVIHLAVIGEGEAGSVAVKVPLVFRTTDGSGANIMGKPLTIQPGMSTGTGTGADLTLATGAQVGAGSTLQVSTPRLVVHGNTGQVEVLAPTGGVAFLVRGFANQAAMQINADAGGPGVMIDFNTTDTVGGAGAGTLTNAPHAGDPDVWIPVSLGGVKYRMPMWLA